MVEVRLIIVCSNCYNVGVMNLERLHVLSLKWNLQSSVFFTMLLHCLSSGNNVIIINVLSSCKIYLHCSLLFRSMIYMYGMLYFLYQFIDQCPVCLPRLCLHYSDWRHALSRLSLCLWSGRSGFAPGSIRLSQKGEILSLCYWLIPTSADDWFKKGRPCVIMSV